MHKRGRSVSRSRQIIFSKIMEIASELIRALEDGRPTSEIIKSVHHQIPELARVYHQLSHLHSEKEGDS
jgi:hypothetical protein